MNPEVVYLADDEIDDAGDAELRRLLTSCFTKPEDAVFKARRYWREPYDHRWVIRDGKGEPVAHVGVHEKSIEAEGRAFRIGGICEVCVHPEFRGRGYVRLILERVHAWLSDNGFLFSVLFGDPRVYGSSGYVEVDNLQLNEDGTRWKPVKAMAKAMLDTPWPKGDVRLVGLKF